VRGKCFEESIRELRSTFIELAISRTSARWEDYIGYERRYKNERSAGMEISSLAIQSDGCDSILEAVLTHRICTFMLQFAVAFQGITGT
jgi:hypothetical protein